MTGLPGELRARLAALPPPLVALLEAELLAGNAIVEAVSCFPAPPVGLCIKLARPVTTRPRRSGGGLFFFDRSSSLSSGEFCDEARRYFVLEPPGPPPPEPDMDAIRAGRDAPGRHDESGRAGTDAVARFARSLVIDHERWRDGVGFDLAALGDATAAERVRIEALLRTRGVTGWREVEALAALGTDGARAMLARAWASGDHEVRMAVLRHAPAMVTEDERTRALVAVLEQGELYGGLTQALAEVASYHPPGVIEALFRGALARGGEAAVHFAAMLTYLHGGAAAPFDWEQRPFFLRFRTEDRGEREAAFRELCARLGVDPDAYVRR